MNGTVLRCRTQATVSCQAQTNSLAGCRLGMKPEFTRNPDPKPELEKYDQNLGLFKLWFGSYKNPASVIQI